MARLAITAAAGAVGAYFGQPGLGLAVGSVLGNLILGPEGQTQKAEGLSPDQLRIQTSRYGAALPIKYGSLRFPAMVTWSSGIIEVENDVDQGGKGGGSSDAAEEPFSYFASWESTFAEGVVPAFSRIWFDSLLMADFRETASVETRRNSEIWVAKYLVFYPGDTDDPADPTIQAYEGAANVPAGRGKCRIVFTDHPLADFGNRLPQVTVELTLQTVSPIEWNTSEPGTPDAPPNSVWTELDALSRWYEGTEPATGNGTFHIGRNLANDGLNFDSGADYQWKCDLKLIDPVTSDRGFLLTMRNTVLQSAVFKVRKDGSLVPGTPTGDLPLLAYSVTPLGDDWFRLSMSGNVGTGTNFALQLRAGLIDGSSFNTQYNYGGAILQARNPSFATTTGAPLGAEPLVDVLTDICTRCAPLVAADINTSEIPPLRAVRGYAVGQQSGRGAIENLQKTHQFDGLESQGKVKFVPRGGPLRATIDTEEMIVAAASVEPLEINRGGELELPKRVSLKYLNQARNYQDGGAHQQRIVTRSNGEQNTDTRVVLTAAEGGQSADVLLNGAWIERTSFKFTLPIKYFYLDPADIIKIIDGSDEYIVRLTGITIQGLVQLVCEGTEENPDLYNSNWTAQNGDFDEGAVGDPTTALLEMMDIPMLVDTQNDTRIHFALSGVSDAWGGGRLYQSRDDGATYQSIQPVTISGRLGSVAGTLPAGNVPYWDTATVMDFDLENPDQALASVSELALLNGANAFAVGVDGRWEVLQAQNIVNTGPGLWRGTRLLRGRLGTEHNVANHGPGDRIVMLSAGFIPTFTTVISELGVIRKYKGVSVSLDPAEVSAVDFAYEGVNLKPYSPVHITGTRDVSNNLTIDWVRRSRFSAKLLHRPILGEASEAYIVEIMSGSTVVRTLTATSPTAAYSAAEQTTDGFTPGDPVDVRITQLSEIVGRGYPGEATL